MRRLATAIISLGVFFVMCNEHDRPQELSIGPDGVAILPDPDTAGGVPLETTLSHRESVRLYTDQQLPAAAISQLLWAAQGVTHDNFKRTAPSAGALYPLEVYLVTPDRTYHYQPSDHTALVISEENLVGSLAETAPSSCVGAAPAVFVIAAVYHRLAVYGDRAERYAALEAGHVAQNILLEGVALGLGGVPIGAFADELVKSTLGLPDDHDPLYLIPIGIPADENE